MKGSTRRRRPLARVACPALLVLACAGEEPEPPQAQPEWERRTIEEVRQTAGWESTVVAHAPRRFRPAGWDGDSVLWGLAVSTVARVAIDDGTSSIGAGVPDARAWSLNAAPGVVSWTDEQGWFVRREGLPPVLRVPMAAAPAGTDGPPQVLWAPDGSRALLTWTGEGATAYALAEVAGGPLTPVGIRIAGYAPAQPLHWLDDHRLLIDVRALVRHDGSGDATESGQRGELAVYDLDAGETRVVAGADDDRFLTSAGLVAPDSVLVYERARDGEVVDVWAYHAASWERRRRPLPSGRAFPHPSGRIAILDERGDSTALFIVEGRIARRIENVHPAPAEPLVWSPDGERVAFLDAAAEPPHLVLVERVQ